MNNVNTNNFMKNLSLAASAVTLVKKHRLLKKEQDYLLLTLAQAEPNQKADLIERLQEIHIELEEITLHLPFEALGELETN